MIHHIICCFFGPRRLQLPELEKNSMYFLEQQIKKINKHASKDVKKVTIVVNPYNDGDLLAKEHAKKIRKDIKCEVVFRKENKGFSYEAWHDVIVQNIEDKSIDYFIISEDDYAPSVDDYGKHFLKMIKKEKASACFQLYAAINGFKNTPLYPTECYVPNHVGNCLINTGQYFTSKTLKTTTDMRNIIR